MGFFSDLKDDLSQAVNELMPEEGAAEVNQAIAPEEEAAGTAKDSFNMDLSQMLDQMGEVEVPVQAVGEESVYIAPMAEKQMTDMKVPSSKKSADEVSVLTESMIINGNMATE